MNFRKAMQLFGYKDLLPISAEQIKSDAAALLRSRHPDAGGSGDIAEVKAARDLLLKTREDIDALEDCVKCDGSGRVKFKYKSRPCPACGGEGQIRRG